MLPRQCCARAEKPQGFETNGWADMSLCSFTRHAAIRGAAGAYFCRVATVCQRRDDMGSNSSSDVDSAIVSMHSPCNFKYVSLSE